MKHVEIGELVSAVPIAPAKMTRRQKLLHWANLLRAHPHPVHLYHRLEYMNPSELSRAQIGTANPSALGVAAADPTFQAQGLTTTTSLGDALRFFELTLHQAHAFSCDCGGMLSNTDQADRIEHLA